MKRLPAIALLLCAAAAASRAAPEAPRRDPFARPAPPPTAAVVADAAPPAPLRLRALILNGARSLANIDGDIVAAGDAARDYRVLRIDARGVLVQRAGRQLLLSMNQEETQ